MTNLFTKSLLWLSFFFFKFLPCLSLKRILHDYGSHNVDMMDLDKLSKREFFTLRLSNHFSRPIKGPKRALWWALLLSFPSSILFHLLCLWSNEMLWWQPGSIPFRWTFRCDQRWHMGQWSSMRLEIQDVMH